MNLRNIMFAAASLVLIWFAAPNFLAAIWMTTGDPILSDIGKGKTPSRAEIETLIESREQTVSIVNSPKGATDAALAYMAQEPTPENLEKAVTSLRSGLKLAPMDAFAWQRLASYLVFVPDGAEEAIAAWKTARGLSEYHTFLWHDRIRVGTQLYRAMTPQDRQLVIEDVERAYAKNRSALRAYARRADLMEWMKFLLRDEEKTAFFST